jgi:hypothetical protein
MFLRSLFSAGPPPPKKKKKKKHGDVSQKTTIGIYYFLINVMWKNKYFLKRGKDDSSVNIRLFTNVFIRKSVLYTVRSESSCVLRLRHVD